MGATMNRFALAVPVQSLVAFVSKAQPCLAHSIFPSTMGISLLCNKAQLLADSTRNLIAVQTFDWGSGAKRPAAVSAYEVRVLDGHQRFRAYPDGKIELQDVPSPPLNTVMVPGRNGPNCREWWEQNSA